jgi:hypothetical protein
MCIRDTELAVEARSSFEKELNFEKVFVPVMEEVMTSIIGKGKAG